MESEVRYESAAGMFGVFDKPNLERCYDTENHQLGSILWRINIPLNGQDWN
jgi:hypothetical protein